MYRFRKWWLHCSYRQDSWQILDSISMPVSKSLWIQTRYLMSHCLILIYMKCTALYREGVVTLRCWMCVPAKSLVEMISNWCCTWEEVQRQTTTHAAISEECNGEETFRRRKAWSIAVTLPPCTNHTRVYNGTLAPFLACKYWVLSRGSFASSWPFRDYIYMFQESKFFLELQWPQAWQIFFFFLK